MATHRIKEGYDTLKVPTSKINTNRSKNSQLAISEIEKILDCLPKADSSAYQRFYKEDNKNNEKLKIERANKFTAIKNGFIKEQVPELLTKVAGITHIPEVPIVKSSTPNVESLLTNNLLAKILATLKSIDNSLKNNTKKTRTKISKIKKTKSKTNTKRKTKKHNG